MMVKVLFKILSHVVFIVVIDADFERVFRQGHGADLVPGPGTGIPAVVQLLLVLSLFEASTALAADVHGVAKVSAARALANVVLGIVNDLGSGWGRGSGLGHGVAVAVVIV